MEPSALTSRIGTVHLFTGDFLLALRAEQGRTYVKGVLPLPQGVQVCSPPIGVNGAHPQKHRNGAVICESG